LFEQKRIRIISQEDMMKKMIIFVSMIFVILSSLFLVTDTDKKE